MPNRNIREGILDSRAVNSLSEPAEILYRRLMSVVDDYGRYEADIDKIRARCFPLQLERWTVDRITQHLSELNGNTGLVTVYSVAGRQYLQINNFGQRLQSLAKFPGPSVEHGEPLNSTVSHGESPESTVSHGESRESTVTRARARSLSMTNTMTNTMTTDAATETAVRECAERMYGIHPKKKDMVLVPGALIAAINGTVTPIDALFAIERCHAEWCRSEDWTKDRARFCPRLPQWISDKGFTVSPPGIKSSTPLFKLKPSDRELAR